MGEQRLQSREIALRGGGEESPSQLVSMPLRGLKARAALLDVVAGAGGELTHVLLALADDRRDLRIPVVEHVAQEQRGALLGREALQQDEHRQRQRVGHLGVAGRIVEAVGQDRLGQPLADVALAPGPRRAKLVDRQPSRHRCRERPGDAICSPASSA